LYQQGRLDLWNGDTKENVSTSKPGGKSDTRYMGNNSAPMGPEMLQQ